MNKSKIEWCDMSFNPVTGCYHDCRKKYCYANKIANRFGGSQLAENCAISPDCEEGWCKSCNQYKQIDKIHVLDRPQYIYYPEKRVDPYPFGFEPTFHKYRLDEPAKKKKSQNIFVVSMGDLFGEWVPDEWIQEVFKACETASQHKYLFLTKNPTRYARMGAARKLPHNKNFWYGSTLTGNGETRFVSPKCDNPGYNTFLSIEPLLNIWNFNPYGEFDAVKWVIIGQQTGPGAKPPKPEWVQSIIDQCKSAGVPVFVKSPLYQQFPIQEWPKELQDQRSDTI